MLRVTVFLAAITLCGIGQAQTFMESSIGDAGEFPGGSFADDTSGTTFNRIIGDASDGVTESGHCYEVELTGAVFGSNGLLGDVNLDGVVSLLDVACFVDRITTETFQAEADVNGDGIVSLLDVSGFVVLLGG